MSKVRDIVIHADEAEHHSLDISCDVPMDAGVRLQCVGNPGTSAIPGRLEHWSTGQRPEVHKPVVKGASMDDRNAPARLSCGTKNAKTTPPFCLSPLQTVTAQYGGDFNARIGPRSLGERFIGPNSAEIRNDAGEILADFCETFHLYHGDSLFFKSPKRGWTHCSPNGPHLHELDHILCNRKVFTDVGVVPSFNTGSDHRLLRARLHFDRMQVCLTQIRQKQTRIKRIDIDVLQSMMDSGSFDMFADIDDDYSRITNIITTLASKCSEASPNHSSQRITDATRSLLEKRRNVDRQKNHVEYIVLSRLCRRKLAEDHKNFSLPRLLDAATNRRSPKRTKQGLAECRNAIRCLRTADGTRTTSRTGIELTMANFYTTLFRTRHGTAALLLATMSRHS
ncbi:unnamed protein product [Nippostrongylus brasiliensis]|uniref:Endo/exonuclease/phosphatase domain-containing protein n=1 Tax=Nippostrongylus brasiliensis TaxID=27835 RepID=A0A0N4Y4N1_NIPBR|nr:unnamed protein product [Nippostrongylus brasiliensis]